MVGAKRRRKPANFGSGSSMWRIALRRSGGRGRRQEGRAFQERSSMNVTESLIMPRCLQMLRDYQEKPRIVAKLKISWPYRSSSPTSWGHSKDIWRALTVIAQWSCHVGATSHCTSPQPRQSTTVSQHPEIGFSMRAIPAFYQDRRIICP